MQWERHSILGVAIDALTLETAVAQVDTWLAQKETKFIATANAEMVMRAYKDPAFGQVLAAADMVLADGAGIVWAGEQLHKHFLARVAGIDFMTALVERAAQTGTKMYSSAARPTSPPKRRSGWKAVSARCRSSACGTAILPRRKMTRLPRTYGKAARSFYSRASAFRNRSIG